MCVKALDQTQSSSYTPVSWTYFDMDRSWPGYHGLLSLQDQQDFTSLPAHSRLLSDPDDSHAQEQGDVMLSRVMSAEEFIKVELQEIPQV